MRIFYLIFLLMVTLQAYASVEYKKFDTPEQEQTYKILIEELRCLVCQNQTIADSNADLAKDLRRQVSEMLREGKSKDQIAEYMTDRYGDFVLYNPPFKAKTGVLWLGPIVFLIIGLVILMLLIRKKSNKKADLDIQQDNELQEKKAKMKVLLEDEDQS